MFIWYGVVNFKLYKYGYVETIIYEIEKTILKLKNEIVNNGMKNNTISELALLIELKRKILNFLINTNI